MLDLTVDQTIALRRHGKKLWSYRNNKPDVVEAAVLDYLRDNGCDGYFTGRDDYLSLFMSLAGWPGKVSNKMNLRSFRSSFILGEATALSVCTNSRTSKPWRRWMRQQSRSCRRSLQFSATGECRVEDISQTSCSSPIT